MVRTIFTLTFVFALAFNVSAQEKKPSKEMLTGVWKLTKSDAMPNGMTMSTTFANNGTLTLEATYNGEKMTAKGNWEMVANTAKVKVTIQAANGQPTTEEIEIVTLTDTKLVTKDSKGKTDEFEKGR